MKKPKQKRSADSLEKVVEAAEKILRVRSANDMTISRIVEESGVSVGAIYARFTDKDGVFQELVSRFMRRTLDEFERIDADHWAQQPLAAFVDRVVATNADIYFAHRGVLRAWLLRRRLVDDPILASAMQRYNRQVGSLLVDLYMAHVAEIEHPKPREAVSVAIETMTALLREHVVFADRQTLDRQAVARVQDLLKRYLQPSVAAAAQMEERAS